MLPVMKKNSRRTRRTWWLPDRDGGYMNKRYAYLGLLAAAAMILGYVESLLPVFAGVPGIKLGLPNLAIVMVL